MFTFPGCIYKCKLRIIEICFFSNIPLNLKSNYVNSNTEIYISILFITSIRMLFSPFFVQCFATRKPTAETKLVIFCTLSMITSPKQSSKK